MRPNCRWFVPPVLAVVLVVGSACLGDAAPPAATGRVTSLPPIESQPDRGTAPYGVTWDAATQDAQLARLDPRTLRSVGATLRLGPGYAMTTSPDRSAALFGNDQGDVLTLVDLPRRRRLGTIKADAGASLRAAWWAGSSRVVLVSSLIATEDTQTVVTVLDVVRRAVVSRNAYRGHGEVVTGVPLRGGLVVLLQPFNEIATAELGVIDDRGGLTTIRLDRVKAGFKGGPESNGEVAQPGLAVDEEGLRAYVVGEGSPVAQVNLPDLNVAYHEPNRPGRKPSPLGWLSQVFVPEAEAKVYQGPVREAIWLGDGRLAVWGEDSSLRQEGDNQIWERKPYGMHILDTRDWTLRMVDPQASQVVKAGSRLIGFGTRAVTGGGEDRWQGDGLRIFTPGTERPVHLFPGRAVDLVRSFGGYLYADTTRPEAASVRRFAVIDLVAGKVLEEREGDLPDLLG